MRYRTLPRTGVEVSEICFGPMRFVPPSSPPDQWGEGQRALSAAIDAGVNFVHSSEEYKTYDALSDALSKHPKRDELRHIIKVESPDYEEGGYDAASLRKQVESALTALHTEQITVVQHLQRGPHTPKVEAYNADGDLRRIPAMQEITEGLMETVEELRQEGKVGAVVSFPHTIGFARAVMESGHFDGMVHFFNVLETEMVELFDEFERREMAFLPIRPVLQGMLTDKRIDRDNLDPDDSRREERWDAWYELLGEVRKTIKETMGDEPDSWTDFTLRFALAPKVIPSVILGLNSVEQVERAVAACDGNYPSEDVVRAVHETSKAFGPIPKETLFG